MILSFEKGRHSSIISNILVFKSYKHKYLPDIRFEKFNTRFSIFPKIVKVTAKIKGCVEVISPNNALVTLRVPRQSFLPYIRKYIYTLNYSENSITLYTFEIQVMHIIESQRAPQHPGGKKAIKRQKKNGKQKINKNAITWNIGQGSLSLTLWGILHRGNPRETRGGEFKKQKKKMITITCV